MPTVGGTGSAAFGAGEGPCGHDPEDDLETLPHQDPIEALEFDPYDRVYAQNDDYSMVEGAGPIQRASHLLLPLGGLGATKSSGLDLVSIRRASPEARLTVVTDALRRTWKTLLETEQIRMGTVTLVGLGPGAAWTGEFEVQVFDLVTKKDATLEQLPSRKLKGRA